MAAMEMAHIPSQFPRLYQVLGFLDAPRASIYGQSISKQHGVSCQWLLSIISNLEDGKDDGLSVLQAALKLRDRVLVAAGASRLWDLVPKEHTGPATVRLVHAWGAPVAESMQALAEHLQHDSAGNDPSTTYAWVDFVALDNCGLCPHITNGPATAASPATTSLDAWAQALASTARQLAADPSMTTVVVADTGGHGLHSMRCMWEAWAGLAHSGYDPLRLAVALPAKHDKGFVGVYVAAATALDLGAVAAADADPLAAQLLWDMSKVASVQRESIELGSALARAARLAAHEQVALRLHAFAAAHNNNNNKQQGPGMTTATATTGAGEGVRGNACAGPLPGKAAAHGLFGRSPSLSAFVHSSNGRLKRQVSWADLSLAGKSVTPPSSHSSCTTHPSVTTGSCASLSPPTSVGSNYCLPTAAGYTGSATPPLKLSPSVGPKLNATMAARAPTAVSTAMDIAAVAATSVQQGGTRSRPGSSGATDLPGIPAASSRRGTEVGDGAELLNDPAAASALAAAAAGKPLWGRQHALLGSDSDSDSEADGDGEREGGGEEVCEEVEEFSAAAAPGITGGSGGHGAAAAAAAGRLCMSLSLTIGASDEESDEEVEQSEDTTEQGSAAGRHSPVQRAKSCGDLGRGEWHKRLSAGLLGLARSGSSTFRRLAAGNAVAAGGERASGQSGAAATPAEPGLVSHARSMPASVQAATLAASHSSLLPGLLTVAVSGGSASNGPSRRGPATTATNTSLLERQPSILDRPPASAPAAVTGLQQLPAARLVVDEAWPQHSPRLSRSNSMASTAAEGLLSPTSSSATPWLLSPTGTHDGASRPPAPWGAASAAADAPCVAGRGQGGVSDPAGPRPPATSPAAAMAGDSAVSRAPFQPPPPITIPSTCAAVATAAAAAEASGGKGGQTPLNPTPPMAGGGGARGASLRRSRSMARLLGGGGVGGVQGPGSGADDATEGDPGSWHSGSYQCDGSGI